MPVSTSCDELLRSRLKPFTRMLRPLQKGGGRSVHRMRVASRRLRELLPILAVEPRTADSLGRRLRKVTKRLGAVREPDALLELLGRLRELHRYDDRALARTIAAITDERSKALNRLQTRLPTGELRRIAAKFEKIQAALTQRGAKAAPRRAWSWAIDARAAQRARALKAAVEDAGPLYLPDRLHHVRIALKKLRYAVELEGDVSPDRQWRVDIAALKRTQDLLGRLRDRQVLIERVREVQTSLQPADLSVWRNLDDLMAAVEKDCRRLHARYLHEAPVLLAMCDRVGGRTRAAAAPGRRAV